MHGVGDSSLVRHLERIHLRKASVQGKGGNLGEQPMACVVNKENRQKGRVPCEVSQFEDGV